MGTSANTLGNKVTGAIIEARMSSVRLPGKVLLPVSGKPLLGHMIERLKRALSLDVIVVATTINEADDPVVALAKRLEVGHFRGSEDDVLGRVLGAAQAYNIDVIVEVTADCPAIDPQIVQLCIGEYFRTGADYVSNTGYPGGMNTTIFATSVLAEVDSTWRDDPLAREHVSLRIYEPPGQYRLHSVKASTELARPDIRVEIDTPEDYEVVKSVFENLYPINPQFGAAELIAYLDTHPEIAAINRHFAYKDDWD